MDDTVNFSVDQTAATLRPYYNAHVFCCINERVPGHRRGCCTTSNASLGTEAKERSRRGHRTANHLHGMWWAIRLPVRMRCLHAAKLCMGLALGTRSRIRESPNQLDCSSNCTDGYNSEVAFNRHTRIGHQGLNCLYHISVLNKYTNHRPPATLVRPRT